MHVAAHLVVLLCSLVVKAAQECRSPGDEPNPPLWYIYYSYCSVLCVYRISIGRPPTVRVLEPSDARNLARAVDRLNGRGELS
jgi:hypothetical protein